MRVLPNTSHWNKYKSRFMKANVFTINHTLPATEKQMKFLSDLGYKAPVNIPLTRFAASRMIGLWKKKRDKQPS